jgi:hypothetical protein
MILLIAIQQEYESRLIINNNTGYLLNQLVWLEISFGISLTISFLLPFPISLAVIFGVFILLNIHMRRLILKRMNAIDGSMSSMLNTQLKILANCQRINVNWYSYLRSGLTKSFVSSSIQVTRRVSF